MPWDAFVFFLSLFDGTFQPTVGEGVAFVEIQVAFVGEEAATSLWRDVPDVVGGDHLGGEVDEVLPPWLHLETLVPHHRELSGLADEHLERVVLLVNGAKGHRVGVEVNDEPESVPGSLLRTHFLNSFVPLHLFHQHCVCRISERVVHVEGAAHPSVSWDPGEDP